MHVAARLRLHAARSRYASAVRPSQTGRWRRLLCGQSQRPYRECRRNVPRLRQGAGTLACRHRQDRTGVVQDCGWAAPPFLSSWNPRAACSWSSASPHATSRTVPTATETVLTNVEGPWSVSFQPDRGAPPSVSMDTLSSWSDSSDPGIKYFSGTGTYTKTIDLEPQR